MFSKVTNFPYSLTSRELKKDETVERTVKIELFDKCKNPLIHFQPEIEFKARLKVFEAKGTAPPVMTDINITKMELPQLEFNYVIDKVAYYTVYIELNERHIPGSPFNMYIGPNK